MITSSNLVGIWIGKSATFVLLKNAIDVRRRTSIQIDTVDAVGDQPAARERRKRIGTADRHWNGPPDRHPKGTPLIDEFWR